jgi:hypothetical protein
MPLPSGQFARAAPTDAATSQVVCGDPRITKDTTVTRLIEEDPAIEMSDDGIAAEGGTVQTLILQTACECRWSYEAQHQ